MGLQPNVGFEIHILDHAKRRVVLFEINPAWNRPICFYGTSFIRVGSSKTELHKHPEKERAIWTSRSDWSAQIVESASLGDLDPGAIAKAREQFLVKHPGQAEEIAGWDELTFLNKAKLAVHGKISNAALLLVGKPESSTLLSPAVARISWILKDDKNKELDYEDRRSDGAKGSAYPRQGLRQEILPRRYRGARSGAPTDLAAGYRQPPSG